MASDFPDDLVSRAAEVLRTAQDHGVKIATAESCTGGLLVALLTETPGSSAVVERGFVTYSNEAKTEMLGVPPELIEQYGAVSESVARAMASGALTHSAAQIAVSITGIAGPGGSDFKPEGRVCFGLARGDTVTVETIEFGAQGRGQVRAAAAQHALTLLTASLDETGEAGMPHR